MDSNSVSMEAQRPIGNVGKDFLVQHEIQSDNGSAFVSLDFKIVLSNCLTHKGTRPHAQEKNGIVERANETIRGEHFE